ncbi:MAG: methyltransferase domain-containing protein [Candidatus Macondimonas sp.]
MAEPPMDWTLAPHLLDDRAVRRRYARAGTGLAHSVLLAEARNRLLERLTYVRLDPQWVIDLGSASGAGSRGLSRRYPQARVVGMDVNLALLAPPRRFRLPLLRSRPLRIQADGLRLPLATASVDLVFSNLVLLALADPFPMFAEIARVLRPGGLFLFTTLGPDTLQEFRRAWAAVDDEPHVHPFLDMHDVGDALVRARLTDPVMDVEHLTFTYDDFSKLQGDLRQAGWGNALIARRHGLTGRRRFEAMQRHYRDQFPGAPLGMTLELIYGHAWAPDQPRSIARDGEVHVPLSSLRRGSGS